VFRKKNKFVEIFLLEVSSSSWCVGGLILENIARASEKPDKSRYQITTDAGIDQACAGQ
jgi:hypothetical protein